jgi:hypothetical protein
MGATQTKICTQPKCANLREPKSKKCSLHSPRSCGEDGCRKKAVERSSWCNDHQDPPEMKTSKSSSSMISKERRKSIAGSEMRSSGSVHSLTREEKLRRFSTSTPDIRKSASTNSLYGPPPSNRASMESGMRKSGSALSISGKSPQISYPTHSAY